MDENGGNKETEMHDELKESTTQKEEEEHVKNKAIDLKEILSFKNEQINLKML